MYSDPLDILDNILVFSMYFVVCHQLLTRRYSLWGTILAESILFVVHILIGNSLPFRSVWRILYWPMLHVTVLCFLYREKWYRILSLVLLLILGVWLTELILPCFGILGAPAFTQETHYCSLKTTISALYRFPVQCGSIHTFLGSICFADP